LAVCCPSTRGAFSELCFERATTIPLCGQTSVNCPADGTSGFEASYLYTHLTDRLLGDEATCCSVAAVSRNNMADESAPKPPATSIDSLPNELLLHIISFLNITNCEPPSISKFDDEPSLALTERDVINNKCQSAYIIMPKVRLLIDSQMYIVQVSIRCSL